MTSEIGKDIQVLNSITFDKICDHMGDFPTFVSCYTAEIVRADVMHVAGEGTILNFWSYSQGKPTLDTFKYVFGSGIQSLKEQFIGQYPVVLQIRESVREF